MAHSGRTLLIVLVLGAFAFVPLVGQAADTTPPWAKIWGPTGTGVPTNTQILVLWSERMDWPSVELSFTLTDGVVTYPQGTWTHSDLQDKSVFVPATLLMPAKRYTVRFQTIATDLAGNRLDQNQNGVGGEPCDIAPPSSWDCLVWSFDTEQPPPDTTPPTVRWTSPPSGGLARTNASIEVRFSESMNTESVEHAFSYGDGYSLYTIADGTASWTATASQDDTLWFLPRLEFASGGQIAVNLRGDTAQDLVGNPLDGDRDGTGGDDFSWSFPVAADSKPPVVVYTHPGPDTGLNSISTSIRVSFSKAMDRAGVEASLSLGAVGEPLITASNGSSTWTGVRFPDDTLYFNPYPNFKRATTYMLRLGADLATDREGSHLDGNGNGTWDGSPADDYVLNFSTELEDRTPPWVSRRTPAAGATGVISSTSIGAVFSEPMNRTTVEAAFSYTDGTSSFDVADGSAVWNSASDELTFRPARSLALGRTYTVTINGSTAEDEAGNLLIGGEDERWSFTTAGQADTTPPAIRSTSPFAKQVNVSLTARISIIFTEAMDKASVRGALGITGGAALTDFRWPNEATVEAGTALPMAYRTSYTVFVLTSATDLAGNRLEQVATIPFTTTPWRGRVTGRVADEGGTGIAGARVQLNGLSTATNDAGEFAFDTVEQGSYTLTVSASGYETYTEPVPINPDQGSLGTITLRRPSVSAIDATLWATVGTALLVVLLLGVWFRRRRRRPGEHYETWKPARVVVIEPGEIPPKGRP